MADSRRTRSNARLIHGRREPEPPLWAIFPPGKARQRRPAFSFFLPSFFFFFLFLLSQNIARALHCRGRSIPRCERFPAPGGGVGRGFFFPKKRLDATTAQTTVLLCRAGDTRRLINRKARGSHEKESGRIRFVIRSEKGGEGEGVARFSFQRSLLAASFASRLDRRSRTITYTRSSKTIRASIFFAAFHRIRRSGYYTRRFRSRLTKGREIRGASPFFFLFFFIFLGCVAMRHAITTYQTSRGRQKEEKKREKKESHHGPVAARWLAFKRSSVSKEEHKGRWCQRGELENDERS